VSRRLVPARCVACGVARVGWTDPRVDFCYTCLPGGPLTPPPCSACGSSRYYSNGLCVACHPHGPEHIESCLGCLAWGASRTYRSRCWTCRWWRQHYVEGDCRCCGRRTVISERRACRLCWETARARQQPGRAVDLGDATPFGQQLFFANMQSSRQTPLRRDTVTTPTTSSPGRLLRLAKIPRGQRFEPVPWVQLPLLALEVDAAVLAAASTAADSDLVRYCDEVIVDHAERHGWNRKHINDVRRTLRLVQVLQHTPNAKVNATDVLKLPALRDSISALSALDVLAGAGLLNDDRISPVERFFNVQIDGLPEAMTGQLRVWFEIMINGSSTAPRRRARHPETAKLHIRALAPILRVWAAHGHDTLASIERAHVVAALPSPGPRRHAADQGLRSLFAVLKSRRLVFVDPTRGVPYTGTNRTVPLPVDTDAIRAALNSPDPAAALAVALVAFHALASREVRQLQLTDIVDGRLTLGERVIPLAGPVLPRLAAWLDHRARRWPGTANPHLFINRRTALRRSAISRTFPWIQVNLAPQTLREDRILDEIRATGGDIRLVCELFGLSVDAALRYLTAADPSDLNPPRRVEPDPTGARDDR
jgi:hypothetical protein